MSANYAFREIVGLTKFLKVLLGLGVAMALVSQIANAQTAHVQTST